MALAVDCCTGVVNCQLLLLLLLKLKLKVLTIHTYIDMKHDVDLIKMIHDMTFMTFMHDFMEYM